MKRQSLPTLVAILLGSLLPLPHASGQLFWDPDGAILGSTVPGNWDTVTTNWTTVADSGVNTVWTQGGDASFVLTNNLSVTLTEPISVVNISVTGTNGTLTLAGASVNNLNLAGSSTLNTGGRGVTINAPISGAFDMTRTGAGTVTLSGSNTYSGGTTLIAGTLAVGTNSVFSGGVVTSGPFGTGPVNFSTTASTISASGGARVLDNPMTLNINLTIAGSSALTFRNSTWMLAGANRTVTVNNTADTTIASNLTDDGVARTLTKAGTGRLILSGTNSGYLGNITINAGGTLAVGSANAIQMPVPSSILTANGTLDLNGFDAQVVGLAGSGSVTLGARTLTIASAGASRNFTGVISGTGSLIVSNIISHQLEGLSTFSGGLFIKAGTLFLRTNIALGDPITKAAGTGTITVEGADPVVVNVTSALGGNAATGLVQITNRIVVTTGRVLLFPSNGGAVQYDSVISGPGGIMRHDSGSGPVILTGNNTYSGGLKVESRVLALGHKNALGTGTFTIGNPTAPPANTINLPAVANLSGANAITNVTVVFQNFTIPDATSGTNNLELSGPMTLSNAVALTVTASGTALVKFSGNIDGPGGLTKAGANSLVLSGANTYALGTTINAGTLLVNNTTGSGTGTGSVSVVSSATLGGNGTIAGPVTVSGGGNIAAGNSAGKLTLLSGLDLSSGGNDTWELAAPKDNSTGTAGTDFDQIAITDGGLNLGSSATLALGFIGATNAPSTTNSFWRTSHAWTVVKLSGLASNVTGTAFSSISPANFSVGNFTNSMAGDGSILLSFLATPAPVISSVTRSGGTINISFLAANGSNYRVEYTTSLRPANWQLLQNVTGTGVPVTIPDANPPDPQRFYRVVLTD